mgnify:CR=1 FL=1
MPRKKPPKPHVNTELDLCAVTKLTTSGEFAALRVLRAGNMTSIGDRLDLPALTNALREQGKAVNNGDLTQAEAMLINQAVALQNLFARLVERGMDADLFPHYETHLSDSCRTLKVSCAWRCGHRRNAPGPWKCWRASRTRPW